MPSELGEIATESETAITGKPRRFSSRTLLGILTLALAIALFPFFSPSILDNPNLSKCGALQDGKCRQDPVSLTKMPKS